MKTKLYFISMVSISIAILALLIFNWFGLQKAYMRVFQKTGVLFHPNGKGKADVEVYMFQDGDLLSTAQYKDGFRDGLEVVYYDNGVIETEYFYKKGKLDGVELDYYDDGKIKAKESFKAGKREGPKITYYQNGQIEQRLFRKNDKDEGMEYGYYDDGKLKYKRNWKNNKLYGDEYGYYEDGKIELYHTYDISGDKFYISRYDESGKRYRSDGDTFGLHTYSRDTTADSLVLLKNHESHKGIRDFYITIANPPDSSIGVKIVINNKRCQHLTFPDNNTVKVVNAFPKNGIYHISVDVAHLKKPNIAGEGTHGEVIVIRSQ